VHPQSVMSLNRKQEHRGAPARPSEGWSVKILPVRSTVVAMPLIEVWDHAFDPAATAAVCTGDWTALAGLFAGASAASIVGVLRMRSVDAT
jgi:hypothetical protein